MNIWIHNSTYLWIIEPQDCDSKHHPLHHKLLSMCIISIVTSDLKIDAIWTVVPSTFKWSVLLHMFIFALLFKKIFIFAFWTLIIGDVSIFVDPPTVAIEMTVIYSCYKYYRRIYNCTWSIGSLLVGIRFWCTIGRHGFGY